MFHELGAEGDIDQQRIVGENHRRMRDAGGNEDQIACPQDHAVVADKVQRRVLEQADQFVEIVVVRTDGRIASVGINPDVAGILLQRDVVIQTLLTQSLQIHLIAEFLQIAGGTMVVGIGRGGACVRNAGQQRSTGGGQREP